MLLGTGARVEPDARRVARRVDHQIAQLLGPARPFEFHFCSQPLFAPRRRERSRSPAKLLLDPADERPGRVFWLEPSGRRKLELVRGEQLAVALRACLRSNRSLPCSLVTVYLGFEICVTLTVGIDFWTCWLTNLLKFVFGQAAALLCLRAGADV